MSLAFNDSGDAVYLDEKTKSWKPAPVASNAKGDKLYFDGKDWTPAPKVSSAGPAKAGASAVPPGAPATPSALKIPGLDIRPPSEYDPSRDPFQTAPGAQMTYGQAAEQAVPLALSAGAGALFDAIAPTLASTPILNTALNFLNRFGPGRILTGAVRSGLSATAGLAGFKAGQGVMQAAEGQPIDVKPTASDIGWFVGTGLGLGALTANMGRYEGFAQEATKEVSAEGRVTPRRLEVVRNMQRAMTGEGYTEEELRIAAGAEAKGREYRQAVNSVLLSNKAEVGKQFDTILGDAKEAPIDGSLVFRRALDLPKEIGGGEANFERASTGMKKLLRGEVPGGAGGQKTVDDLLTFRTELEKATQDGNAVDGWLANQMIQHVDGMIERAAPEADQSALTAARDAWAENRELAKLLKNPSRLGVGQANALWNLATRNPTQFQKFLTFAQKYDAVNPDANILATLKETWMVRAQAAMDAPGAEATVAGRLDALRKALNGVTTDQRAMLFGRGSPLREDRTWIKLFGRAGSPEAKALAREGASTNMGQRWMYRMGLLVGLYGAGKYVFGVHSKSRSPWGAIYSGQPGEQAIALGSLFMSGFLTSRTGMRVLMSNWGDIAGQRAYVNYLTKPNELGAMKAFFTALTGALQGGYIGAQVGHPVAGAALGSALALGFHKYMETEGKVAEPPQGSPGAPTSETPPPTVTPPAAPQPPIQPVAAGGGQGQPVQPARPLVLSPTRQPPFQRPPVQENLGLPAGESRAPERAATSPQPIPPQLQAPAMQALSNMRRPPKQERIAPSLLLNRPAAAKIAFREPLNEAHLSATEQADMRVLKNKLASLPKISSGMTRLYRAESSEKGQLPDWIKTQPEYKASQEASGRWFTKDIEDLLWYHTEAGAKPIVKYFDVPISELDNYLVSNLPEVRKFSANPRNEFFLSREQADKAAIAPPPPEPSLKEIRPQPNGTIVQFPTKSLKLDPGAFQFKQNYDPRTGVVRGSIAEDIQAWQPLSGGVLGVWHDADTGEFIVGSGHQRFNGAQRLGVDKLPVMIVTSGKEATIQTPAGPVQAIATGMSKKAAASYFARRELEQRTATASTLDLAKVIRIEGKTPEQLATEGLAASTDVARKALGLANLADPIFHFTALGQFDENYAAMIGNAMPTNKAMQMGAFERIRELQQKGKSLSIGVVQEFINEARFAGTEQTETADLFGSKQVESSLVYERAQLAAKLKQSLRTVKATTGTAVKHADILSEANTVVDVETGQRITKESAQALATYDRLARTGQGEISKAMKKAAADLHNAKSPTAAKRVMAESMKTLRDALRSDLAKLSSAGPSSAPVPEAPELDLK